MSENKINIDVEKVVNHWINTSEEDFKTMKYLFEAKSYNWSLFLGHISVEKLLKAYYVKKHQNHAPLTHNLYRLAELSGIALTDEYADYLDKITSFNLNARYDDYKREFFNLCTYEFANEWIEKINEIRLWIRQML
jgi:HEPN domain-containing protein